MRHRLRDRGPPVQPSQRVLNLAQPGERGSPPSEPFDRFHDLGVLNRHHARARHRRKLPHFFIGQGPRPRQGRSRRRHTPPRLTPPHHPPPIRALRDPSPSRPISDDLSSCFPLSDDTLLHAIFDRKSPILSYFGQDRQKALSTSPLDFTRLSAQNKGVAGGRIERFALLFQWEFWRNV